MRTQHRTGSKISQAGDGCERVTSVVTAGVCCWRGPQLGVPLNTLKKIFWLQKKKRAAVTVVKTPGSESDFDEGLSCEGGGDTNTKKKMVQNSNRKLFIIPVKINPGITQ